MSSILTAWRLWRLVRRLEHDEGRQKAANIGILVEPDSHYEARVAQALIMGKPKPPREECFEVSYYPDVSRSAMVRRGPTLAAALKSALDRPHRDSADGMLV